MAHIIVLICFLVFACCEGYYWREWNGTVPEDAFRAGKDSRGDAYIAQAFIAKTGVYIGEIFSHQQEVYLNTVVYGKKPVYQSDYELKILCTDQNDLTWMVSNLNRTREILKNRGVQFVKGGVTVDNNTVYIGKYFDKVNVFVGSVHGDWRPNNYPEYWFYFSNLVPLSDFSTYYEILITE